MRGHWIVILLSLISVNLVGAEPHRVWMYGSKYFGLEPVYLKNSSEIVDIRILKSRSLKELCGSDKRYNQEVRRIQSFLSDFITEVDKHPSSKPYLELENKRKDVILNEDKTFERVQLKKHKVALSKIMTQQTNMYNQIERWERKLADVFRILIRVKPDGKSLKSIEFVKPKQDFFQQNEKVYLVKYTL